MAAQWNLPALVSLADLGPLDESISQAAGESVGIHPVSRQPGWLVKVYKAPLPGEETKHLTELVNLPSIASDEERAVIAASTSWPVAVVADDPSRALGCVIPAAAAKFRTTFRPPGGPPAERALEIDFLALKDDGFARRGIAAVTAEQRRAVCRNLVAVAELLDRHRLVYSDWSYSNAFWSATDHSVFVIDIDGCAPVRAPNVYQPNWDDPLTPRSEPADRHTDRYRVALLVARCLTGERDRNRALHALGDLQAPALSEVLLDILLSTERVARPSLTALRVALAGQSYVRFPVPRAPLPPRPPAITVPTVPIQPAARPTPVGTGAGAGATGSGDGMRTATAIAAGVIVVLVIALCLAIAIAGS
ncbi:hypothetical protein [Phytohabitans kaempferiae]|uniref:Aminoglycoside phosphotransferase domain-containing protein n=1 Tax=Phytohabitans kaempferiae TaxID=1620943 RepID=A0ABV6LUJ1_9ACTN